MMRKVAPLLVLIFGGFAAVQFNDPDTEGWVLIYAIAAAVWLFPSSKQLRPVAGVLAAVSMFWMFSLLPGFRMDLGHEVTREVLGLLIVVVCSIARAIK